MKKFLIFLLIAISTIIYTNKANALSYKEAANSSKPMALFIYASWADDLQNLQTSFTTMSQKYTKDYNFVALDIASEDTKEFNKKFYIYPNLPYIVLMRDNGKVSRYLKKDCILSSSCFEEKLRFFINK